MCDTKYLNKYNRLRHFEKYFRKPFSMQNNSKSFHPHRNGVLLLTLIQPMFPSYINQSADLQSKSVDWFLYHGNIGC